MAKTTKISNSKIGVSGHGDAWAGFSHASAGASNSYGFLHHIDGIYSLINKKSGGGHIGFRRDNQDMLKMGDDGVLQVMSNKFNNAHIGVSGHGGAWAGFSHASAGGNHNYGFLHHQDGVYSLINKKSGGGHIGFRRDNEDMLKMGDDGVLQVMSNKFNNAHIGVSGHGGAWAGFSHASAGGNHNYGFLHHQDGCYSLINKKSGGGHIGFRVDNKDVVTIKDGGAMWVAGDLSGPTVDAMKQELGELRDEITALRAQVSASRAAPSVAVATPVGDTALSFVDIGVLKRAKTALDAGCVSLAEYEEIKKQYLLDGQT